MKVCLDIDGRSQQLPISCLSGPYQHPIGVAGKSAEVVRKMSLCKHKRLPAHRVYSMKHTAKCFKARLARYHYRGCWQSCAMENSAFGFRLKWRGLLIVRRIERKAEGRKPDLVLRLAQRLLRANRPNSQIEKDDRWL